MSAFICHQDAADHELGRKAASLAALRHADILIPDWFVVSVNAFHDSLSAAQRSRLQAVTEPTALFSLIRKLLPSDAVRGEVLRAMDELCPDGARVAVRSSACTEDGLQNSYAGQFDSFLFVHREALAEKIAAVWRSAFSERIASYRRSCGLHALTEAPAVLIQRMVDADVSGVAFSADPVSGRRSVAVVEALHGLGTALVSGDCDADTYHVGLDGRILQRDIVEKHFAHRYDPGALDGLRRTQLAPGDARRAALSDEQIAAVAELARKVSRLFGRPQDIEWAIADGQIYLLQSRPITTLTNTGDPDGALILWDNSNIAESYNGVTTPLTFSFARHAYATVYRQFCRVMGVPQRVIIDHEDTFQRMIGLVRGRLYYNLRSWYEVLSVLPGFALNRQFMEQMMGVKEKMPAALISVRPSAGRGERMKDVLRLARTIVGLTVNLCLLPRRIRRFDRCINAALAAGSIEQGDLRADELAAHYHDLERRLLSRWDAPIVNDFFTMIFFGALRRLTHKWCGDNDGSIANQLLRGAGDLISVEPAAAMREMARIATERPDFVHLLNHGSLDAILTAMSAQPDFQQNYTRYLKRFGERCIGELKLESPTLHDDPLGLLRAVGGLARQTRVADPKTSSPKQPLEDSAEQRIRQAFTGKPLRRLLFAWALNQARARVRVRENLRFQRTRVFAHARRIFIEMGKRFYALDALESPRDVFYLEVGEILGFIDGTTTTTDLKGLAALRKMEFTAFRETPPPDDRFETHGIVYSGNNFRRAAGPTMPSEPSQCRGIGCSPGMARGPVRIIRDPARAVVHEGDILVTERTDPGWVMLFSAAAGVLVEHGSLLSHAAVLSREMGIPAVVSVDGVTCWAKDGDWVEIDGGSGIVRRIANPTAEHGHA